MLLNADMPPKLACSHTFVCRFCSMCVCVCVCFSTCQHILEHLRPPCRSRCLHKVDVFPSCSLPERRFHPAGEVNAFRQLNKRFAYQKKHVGAHESPGQTEDLAW